MSSEKEGCDETGQPVGANSASATMREQLKVVATLSHELRTPLHAILALSEILKSEEMSQTAKIYAAKIHTASKGLMDSLNKAIEASRGESGELKLTVGPTDLLGVVEDTFRTFSISATGKGLELELNFDPQLYSIGVETDGVHLQQVLNNLIGNAIKFTDSGKITVWVVMRQRSLTQVQVSFFVRDTGIGIPAEHLNRILQPFEQISSSQKGRPLGSGLGLSICRQIIELFNSELQFRSEPSKGTTVDFSLTMPIVSRARDDVVVADDVLCMLIVPRGVGFEMIETYLMHWGCKVVQIESIADAQKLPNADLVIVDERCARANETVCADLAIRYGQGRFLLLRDEVLGYQPDLVFGATEMLKPLLPSDLSAFIHQSGTAARIKTAIERPGSDETEREPPLLRVLGVDDTPTNLLVLQAQLLKQEKIEFFSAVNGQEAVDFVTSQPEIDLVFMDINMPVLDGIEATRQLRAQGFVAPVIGLTALDGSAIELSQASGVFDSVITKPAQLSDIERVVAEARAVLDSGKIGIEKQ